MLVVDESASTVTAIDPARVSLGDSAIIPSTAKVMADDVSRVSGRVRKRSARLADFEDLNDSADVNNKRPR